METTELGKDTVDGHPCVKNKVIVTDNEGSKHESTVWNATDLKNFPVKIETDRTGRQTMTMLFKNVSTRQTRCQPVRAALRLHKIRQHTSQ